LKKVLPRIPIVEKLDDFIKIKNIGQELAKLHLDYENVKMYNKCDILIKNENYIVDKMKFGSGKDKTIIHYNNNILIKNIPLKAYEYVISGKSAIEWIMERYSVTFDKKSGISNNPNDWCKEVNDEKYIFNLLLRIINVSIKTVDLINQIPKLNLE
jgi:predicted helicase